MAFFKNNLFSEKYNTESKAFCSSINEVRELFFSRDPKKWPLYSHPEFKQLINFRKENHLPPQDLLKAFPNGESMEQKLKATSSIPAEWSAKSQSIDSLLSFAACLSKNWEDPAAVENVVTLPCDPAVHGSMMAVVANPNLIYREYSGMADEMEKTVVRMMAELAGYDPAEATGVFTQGGTFCNMYGYLFGLRKSLPESVYQGIEPAQDYRIIHSQGGHYSNTTNLSVLGVNIEKKTIRIKITDQNDIDIKDLRVQLEACFRLGCVVPTIMLTMGTTDTFGVDRVKPVYDLVEELCEVFEIETKPHIHVDAAVGWPILFFLNYDFTNNPLQINEATLSGLQRNVKRFQEMRYADSFTVDFQKWGFVPYTSSLVMVKNKSSMKALEHDPENFSYFERDQQGQTHLQSTIECSRGAVGLFGTFNALTHMGVKGYQVLIAHALQNANYFRSQLCQDSHTRIIASSNSGPSVGFRLYDEDLVADPYEEYKFEKNFDGECEKYHARVSRNNAHHRKVFLRRGKQHLYTNWVEMIAHSNYDEKGKWAKLPGEKAVFMNPMTTRTQIDNYMQLLHAK